MICAACNADLGVVERLGRRDVCPRCGVDLRTCRNCTFHEPRASNQCREPQAERVLDKTRSNFCEYFVMRAASRPSESGRSSERADGVRDALERLFRGR